MDSDNSSNGKQSPLVGVFSKVNRRAKEARKVIPISGKLWHESRADRERFQRFAADCKQRLEKTTRLTESYADKPFICGDGCAACRNSPFYGKHLQL